MIFILFIFLIMNLCWIYVFSSYIIIIGSQDVILNEELNSQPVVHFQLYKGVSKLDENWLSDKQNTDLRSIFQNLAAKSIVWISPTEIWASLVISCDYLTTESTVKYILSWYSYWMCSSKMLIFAQFLGQNLWYLVHMPIYGHIFFCS